MFNSTNNKPTALKVVVTAIFIAGLACAPLAIAQEHEHGGDAAASKEVTGEVVDMMCYVDHNAVGEKHGQSCGAKCIKSGGPARLVRGGTGGGAKEKESGGPWGAGREVKGFWVDGKKKPMNDQLAEYCGKTVTLKG